MKFIKLGKSTLSVNHMERNNNKTDVVNTDTDKCVCLPVLYTTFQSEHTTPL